MGGNNFGNNMNNPMMYPPYMMDPQLLFYMQSQMGMYPNMDPSQMQQFGNMQMDPNSVNLNTSGGANPNMFPQEMGGQPNFNMNGVYNMYPGQSGNN